MERRKTFEENMKRRISGKKGKKKKICGKYGSEEDMKDEERKYMYSECSVLSLDYHTTRRTSAATKHFLPLLHACAVKPPFSEDAAGEVPRRYADAPAASWRALQKAAKHLLPTPTGAVAVRCRSRTAAVYEGWRIAVLRRCCESEENG